MSKPRGEGPSPPFLQPPKSFPEGLFMTMLILGRSSLPWGILLTHYWLTGQTWGQTGRSKVGRGGAPAREISFVSLVAYGPKVCHSALAMGVYSFLN